MTSKTRFKISEFANLCGITRDTLLHYDKKDLLKPKYKEANGYRMYEAEQYFEFELISLLKHTGMSLEEIKTYRASCSDFEYLRVIKNQVSQFEQELLILRQKIDSIKLLLKLADEVAAKPADTVFFEQREQEEMEIFPLGIDDDKEPIDYIESYSKYLQSHKTCGEIIPSPLGAVIARQQALQGKFKLIGLFSQKSSSRPSTLNPGCSVAVRPGGTYACIISHGKFTNHRQACMQLLTACKRLGAVTEGEIWSLDLIS